MRGVVIVGSGFVTLLVFGVILKLAGPIIERGDWLALAVIFAIWIGGLVALATVPAFLVERLRPRP